MKNNVEIHQVMEKIRTRLIKTSLQNIFSQNNGYAADESGDVIGLNLSGQHLKSVGFLKDFRTLQWLDLSNNMISDISVLTPLENLVKLDLSRNRIIDISCLRELKRLNWVNLGNNRISGLPRDIMEWSMEIKWESENKSGIRLVGNPLEETLKSAIEGGRKTLNEYLIEQCEDQRPNLIKFILVLAANPRRTDELRLGQEVREIEEGLRRSKYRDRFEIRSKWAVRVEDIRRALLDYKPQLVHFTGHGTEAGLVVEDEFGLPEVVSIEALSELFSLFADTVECVLLDACYSAQKADAMSRHINYVIGMQKEIKEKAAIAFAVGFYDALGGGRSVDDAFKLGCNAIHLKFPDQMEHVVPVLRKGEIP